MKTIFVPVSGTVTDSGVFATALSLARSLHGSHIGFYHLRLDPCESALRDPHANFCIGAAVGATLSFFQSRDEALAGDAVHHFQDFCEAHDVPVLEAPMPGQELSAGWLEETNYPEERLLFQARHSDVTVLGRKHTMDLMPPGMIGQMMKESGRPVVVAPDLWTPAPLQTIMVGWQETAGCARALTAAMPLLARASRVILLNVTQEMDHARPRLDHLARQLSWNGIAAEVMLLRESSATVAQQLNETAAAQRADLLVIGGYGHNAFREHYFGGVTRDLLHAANLPIFLMH